jgi:hypothetical protein
MKRSYGWLWLLIAWAVTFVLCLIFFPSPKKPLAWVYAGDRLVGEGLILVSQNCSDAFYNAGSGAWDPNTLKKVKECDTKYINASDASIWAALYMGVLQDGKYKADEKKTRKQFAIAAACAIESIEYGKGVLAKYGKTLKYRASELPFILEVAKDLAGKEKCVAQEPTPLWQRDP